MKPFVNVICLLSILSLAGFTGPHAGWIEDGTPLMRQWGSVGTAATIPDGSSGAIVAYQACHEGIGRIHVQRIDSLGVIQWGDEGVVVCPADGHQETPRIASDGAGGAIITWCDYRNGHFDIYAQRVNASGAIVWTPDGVPLCLESRDQNEPQITYNDAGGAIVVWQDDRSGTPSAYAQLVDTLGTVQWMANGVALCSATQGHFNPMITSDGTGGAIVSWYESRTGNFNIYAQRVDVLGAVQWTTSGLDICTATGNQQYPRIISDGAGGAVITWQDYRAGNYDIYAQKVNALGVAQWTANGVALCTATSSQQYQQITTDGAGGAIVTWEDARSGSPRIYAQRANAAGVIQWTADGVALTNATAGQYKPTITSDYAGGAIVTWGGYGMGSPDFAIFAQRVNGSGASVWSAANGAAICMATGNQANPLIVSDGAGGAIINWQDSRNANAAIYVQRVNASGTVRWTTDGVALTAPVGIQGYPRIASDGASGAIITWQDNRNGSYNAYAQRLNASGDARWTTDGVALSTTTGGYPAIAPDGSGGAIVAWISNLDIYAQRVNASGIAQWTTNGVAVCTAAQTQQEPEIAADGMGGAVITWLDFRNGNADCYAQRVDASGAVQWTTNGVAICTATGEQRYFQIISDGAGGAIITWQDFRSAATYDIYAQRVDASGAVLWTADGVAVCAATGSQFYPTIASDGASGAIITWFDTRTGDYNVYAQRVDASGTALWTTDGVAICTATGNQYNPTIATDGAGGAIITWGDARSSGNPNIYAQRVDASGAVQWAANGAAVCTFSGSQEVPQIISDGAGGAVITWQDVRIGGTYDIYAQRVNALGAALWLADGVAMCTARSSQQSPRITTDGGGGAIIAWTDSRCGSWIYAQRVRGTGVIVATMLRHFSAAVIESGICIDWSLSEADGSARFLVSRASALDWEFARLDNATIEKAGLSFTFTDETCLPGWTYKYRVECEAEGMPRRVLFETEPITMPSLPVTLFQNRPNPFNPQTVIRFYLPADQEISLDVYDVAGRHVARLAEGKKEHGYHEVSWDGRNGRGTLCASGVYFSRLTSESGVFTRKMVLMR